MTSALPVLISAEQIHRRVGELAAEIAPAFRGRPLTIVGVLTGIGFGILVLFGALGAREPRLQLFGKRKSEAAGTKSVPVA